MTFSCFIRLLVKKALEMFEKQSSYEIKRFLDLE